MALRKLKFIAPYKKDGSCNFRKAVNKAGVYLIKENAKIVYVGFSGYNIYKTMYRHFETWTASQNVVCYKDRLKKKDYTVRMVLCSEKQAYSLEKALILKHKPRDNKDMYETFKLKQYDKNVYEEYQVTEVEVPF